MKYDAESIKKRKSISNKVKKIIFIFMIILLYNLTLIYISYMNKYDAPSFLNFKAFIVSTASMKPELDIDDVVIVEACDEKELHVGNIVTYWADDEVVTHRIVKISDDAIRKYYTKGDNNNVGDKQYVTFNDIEGKMVFKIPGLGKLFKNIKEGIVVILVLLVILVLYLNNIGSKELSKKRRQIKKYEDDKFKIEKKKREAHKQKKLEEEKLKEANRIKKLEEEKLAAEAKLREANILEGIDSIQKSEKENVKDEINNIIHKNKRSLRRKQRHKEKVLAK